MYNFYSKKICLLNHTHLQIIHRMQRTQTPYVMANTMKVLFWKVVDGTLWNWFYSESKMVKYGQFHTAQLTSHLRVKVELGSGLGFHAGRSTSWNCLQGTHRGLPSLEILIKPNKDKDFHLRGCSWGGSSKVFTYSLPAMCFIFGYKI